MAELMAGQVYLGEIRQAIPVMFDTINRTAQEVAAQEVLDDQRCNGALSPCAIVGRPASRIIRCLAFPTLPKELRKFLSPRGALPPTRITRLANRRHSLMAHKPKDTTDRPRGVRPRGETERRHPSSRRFEIAFCISSL